MKISLLDQSPVREGGSFRQALNETLELANHADQLGFHRFWVSEHHGSPLLAGSAPEVLLAAIGAKTQRIRIGSGGVMLPHYSAYKVAETFSLLSTLYPNRVDLGVGRAPGTDMETARVLAQSGHPDFERFPTQIDELRRRMSDPSARPALTPLASTPTPIWVLGSSPSSAMLAAQKGLPYNFARFINNEMGPELFDLYRQEFQPSDANPSPQAILTLDVFVAETEQEALRQSLSWQVIWAQMMRGSHNIRVPSIDNAKSFRFSAAERMYLNRKIDRSVIGDPRGVRQKLESIAREFGTDEIMTVTITHDFAHRLKSYERLSQAFSLAPAVSAARDSYVGSDHHRTRSAADGAVAS